ncbi:MAG: ABC transporter ATP-binding protein [Sphaerochaetaceae bacterium]|nr:ABC transporter ATP-binding protein [Sphaerochaetaceae bacterium]MDC7238167.1 ABC transporter ATP-binding protein [Sphaerochaetaceae bacterium]
MFHIITLFLQLLGKNNKKDFKLSIFWNFIKSFGLGLQLLAILIVMKAIANNSLDKNIAIQSFIVMLCSIIITYVAVFYGRIYDVKSSFNMCADKRRDIGNKLRYLPMGYFSKNSVGHITAVATNTLDLLQNVGSMVVMNSVSGIINATVLLAFITVFDYRMGLVIVVTLGLFSALSFLTRRKGNKVAPKKFESDNRLVSSVIQYLQGLSVIRSFNLIKDANSILKSDIKACENFSIKTELKLIPFIALQNLSIFLGSFMMVVSAIFLHLIGEMEVSMTITMLIASFMMFTEIQNAGLLSSLISLVRVGMAEVKAVVESESMVENDVNGHMDSYDISAKNITFSYDKKTILKDVSFDLKQGTTTAIVGPSGGGKSTICNLIPRFWDVDSGTLKIGGINVKDYKVDHLLSNISMVFQNVYLFNDTIANNIKFAKPEATMDQVISVAKKACAHDFIMKLEKGYDTIVGEGGYNISGGEKQRISIARAMIKDANIIILDEATANVDPENEMLLQKAIKELTQNKTVIMIAHRLSTVRNADKILVVEDGQITENGTHEELMKNKKTYEKFINMRRLSVGWKLGVK